MRHKPVLALWLTASLFVGCYKKRDSASMAFADSLFDDLGLSSLSLDIPDTLEVAVGTSFKSQTLSNSNRTEKKSAEACKTMY